MMLDNYKNKKIFITGNTGFKGTWLCKTLLQAGAQVYGYSLPLREEDKLYSLCKLDNEMETIYGDIRDYDKLSRVFNQIKPEIVIHLAAQPIVRESYMNPTDTYSINVMGTVNILECIRNSDCVSSFLNVTTDKVYKNREWVWGYRENEELDGYDPYSNSKSCSELVTHSYRNSFFEERRLPISTARAGNVLGGGDFAKDRIIPDCIRAIANNREMIVRNPYSTRPYQHVLEPLFAYLLIAEKQQGDYSYADWYNVGPDESDCITTGELVGLFAEKWNSISTQKFVWRVECDKGPHEANFLKLDCSKIKQKLKWQATWHIDDTIDKIIEWSYAYLTGENIVSVMEKQINEFQWGQK